MTTDGDLDAAIERILADRVGVDPAAFDDETRLAEDPLGLDSLGLVETAEAVDATLGVYLPDDALDAVETVGDLKARVRAERD